MKFLKLAVCIALLAVECAWGAQSSRFYLHQGDRVVFYGDSITEQRMYTIIIETYVATRYPDLDVSFVNSGWGGDTVYGGGGGPIDTRLTRDVFPYHPTVVTVMLGMNDGGYHAETVATDEKYFSGYKHLVEMLKQHLPESHIVLLQPTPYDTVTGQPALPVLEDVDYNEVMRSFGKWVANYADQMGLETIDMNTPMVNTLIEAHKLDPATSQQIIPGHIHPSFAGHLFMAAEILKAWKSRPTVSSVVIDAAPSTPRVESARFTKISQLSRNGTLSWTELDESLPLPFRQWQDMWGGAAVSLVLRSSNVTKLLNEEILKVRGLKPGTYSLKIDGKSVGAFNNDKLSAGINLALLKTPETDQAMKVYRLAVSHEEIHFDEWRNIQVPLADYHLEQAQSAIDSLTALDNAVAAEMRKVAQPVSHQFELVPIS
jgi:lysophospholipase L1-like esterase